MGTVRQADPPFRSTRTLKLVLVATAAVLFALLAYGLREQGGWLALGLTAGVLAATGTGFTLAMLRPVGELAVAIRPLGIPLLLVLAAGTVDSPLVLQLAAGVVATLVAVRLFIVPEWSDVGQAWERLRRVGLSAAVPALVLALFVVAAANLNVSTGEAPEDRGGLATAAFAAAAVLLVAAVVLRLLGYGRSPLRAVVSLLLLAALARLGMQLGILPFHDELVMGAPWLDTNLVFAYAGAAVLGAAMFEVLTDLVHEAAPSWPLAMLAQGARPRAFGSTARWLSVSGLVAAVLSALMLLLAMVLAANPGQASGKLRDEISPVAPARSHVPPASLSDLELARTYSPVLLFSSRGRWAPTVVDRFVAAATVRDWENRDLPGARIDTLTDCPGVVPAPCYKLTTDCDDGDAPCARGANRAPGQRIEDGTVYVRVVKRGRLLRDGSPNPFEPAGDLARRATILVQYWYFYDFDEWIAPVLAGQIRQYHEADWEAVTIGFSDSEPLFVGLSQHCGGQWYPWEAMRVDDRPGFRLRPLVAVADGSQANYRYPNPHQAPDWSGCANLPARTTTLVSYASNIRDRTGADWSWAAAHHRLVDATTPPMNFVGRWAPHSRTELDTLHRDQTLGPDAPGPATPSLQALWREPMRTVFRTPRWHRGHGS